MPFSKTLVVLLGILTIIPSATIKAVNANTTTKDIHNVAPECINYMITSGGETICLDSEPPAASDPSPAASTTPAESAPTPAASTADLECSPEPTAEVASEPGSVGAVESESIVSIKSPSDPATAAESSPEPLADAACSPDSSVEDLESSP